MIIIMGSFMFCRVLTCLLVPQMAGLGAEPLEAYCITVIAIKNRIGGCMCECLCACVWLGGWVGGRGVWVRRSAS